MECLWMVHMWYYAMNVNDPWNAIEWCIYDNMQGNECFMNESYDLDTWTRLQVWYYWTKMFGALHMTKYSCQLLTLNTEIMDMDMEKGMCDCSYGAMPSKLLYDLTTELRWLSNLWEALQDITPVCQETYGSFIVIARPMGHRPLGRTAVIMLFPRQCISFTQLQHLMKKDLSMNVLISYVLYVLVIRIWFMFLPLYELYRIWYDERCYMI